MFQVPHDPDRVYRVRKYVISLIVGIVPICIITWYTLSGLSIIIGGLGMMLWASMLWIKIFGTR